MIQGKGAGLDVKYQSGHGGRRVEGKKKSPEWNIGLAAEWNPFW
jgi:hypothetical protein